MTSHVPLALRTRPNESKGPYNFLEKQFLCCSLCLSYRRSPTITHALRTKEQTCDRARGSSWFSHFTCSNSLTLSMGATAVLEMAAAMPPAKKSFIKLTTASDMIGCFLWRSETSDFSKGGQDPQGNPTLLQVDEAPPCVLIYAGQLSRES